ncbi:hypothetical protein H310_09150 [Aphanomyces invadans]|uniref:Bifunctional GlmU protein n=1 Tax=Aphanomyces invadans TaxID=157072 RepID=A0A024TUZ2_9STRA|nr:hypothetical protein H310_09150 [Aphanomyces invadans]ETV97799.1 hypothetical protein H310_09150 [Aphanomyces invadans]|eukprot:XP_008873360.1 hypothetical protein H310_09150 [Aphanomyces invadans]
MAPFESTAMAAWLPLVVSLVTSCATMYYVHLMQGSITRSETDPKSEPVPTATEQSSERRQRRRVNVNCLALADVPTVLRPSFYFRHLQDFKHYDLFQNATNVFSVLDSLHGYVEQWLQSNVPDIGIQAKTSVKTCKVGEVTLTCPDPSVANACTILNYDTTTTRRLCLDAGVRILGGILDVTDGSIFLGKNVVVEPNVCIKGPAIVGDGTVLRFGAYLRGDVIIGKHCVIRSEVKHSVIMDHAELCHPGYCGDSLCGYKSHFANQVSTANLALFASTKSLFVTVNDVEYDTGRRKVGVVLGDFSQLGCNVATDPCTLVGVHTSVYPLTRVNKGVYGPNEIVKNKPLEHGVIERAKVRGADATTE